MKKTLILSFMTVLILSAQTWAKDKTRIAVVDFAATDLPLDALLESRVVAVRRQ